MTSLLACLIGLWVPNTQVPSEKPTGTPPAPHVHDYGGVGFPIVAYTPETSGLVALVGLGFFPGGGARPSSIRLTSLYTLNNQAAIVLDPSLSFVGGDWELEGRISAIRWRFPFQGFDGQGKRLWYTQPAFSAEMVFSRRVVDAFYLGLGGHYSRTGITQEDALPDDLVGRRGGRMGGASLELRYDSRDHPVAARNGQRFLARFDARPPAASDFAHNRFTTEARVFVSSGRHTLATQAMWYGIWGEAPFFALNTFGGQSEMRGVFRDRYRNHHSTYVQAEYRSPPLFWRFGFAGFGGVGATFGPLGPFASTWSGGAGLRVLLLSDRRINLRIDGAFSADETGAYLGLGEAF